MRIPKIAAWLAAGAALALTGSPAGASSHSDAPLIKLDPQANLTDVYAFIRVVNNVKLLNIVINVRPFSNPGDGVMYDAFSPDARYSIHIADPATGATRQRYDFRFSPVGAAGGDYKNLNTILRYGLGTEAGPILTPGDARQNFTQKYTVTKVVGSQSTSLSGSQPLLVAPPNVGKNTTPKYNDAQGRAISGAITPDDLDDYTKNTIYNLGNNVTVFCGPREDSFFADTAGIFDLLNSRILQQDGNGVDDFKGYNVLTYSLRIPVDSLGLGNNPTVGVYASVSRQRVSIRNGNGTTVNSGPWVQVNRLGNPLFNEVLVALKDKDNYNASSPTVDAAKFKTYAQNPEVAFLINFVVFGDPTGQTPLQTNNRTDLVGVYIPDVLRVDTSTGATRVPGESGFNRLSFLGGDTILNGQSQAVPAGWPNGRRLGDDVVDIALTVVASGPTFQTIIPVGDNVNGNDQAYHRVFPYAATPVSGTFIVHDPEP